MNRLLTLTLFLFVTAGLAFGAETDKNWQNRNSFSGALKNYEFYKAEFAKNKTYENAWKLARAAQFFGDNFATNQDMKLNLFTEGKKAAEDATNLGYDKVEGHYYLGICLGLWGDANGVMQSLFAVGGILSESTMAIKIDPKFADAGGYVLRGRLYNKAPGVISIGDPKKSEADYEKAIAIAPTRIVYRFYAELLLELGQKDKAKEIIQKGIGLPSNKEDKIVDDKELSILKELQKKV